MNIKLKQPWLFVIGGLVAGILLSVGILALRNDWGNTTSMGQKDMDRAMQSMMGVKTADALPRKKATDQKPLEPTVIGDVKEFTLTAEPIAWEYASGKTITAWAYNGQIPGPKVHVKEGDKVRVKLVNKLPKATTVHWHGINVPYTMDGVPGVSQEAVKPGETFIYEFTATPAGTHFYHTHGSAHSDEAQQMDMGLSGVFIVEPANYQKPDKEFTLVLDDWQKNGNDFNMGMMDMGMNHNTMNYNLFTINGLSAPDAKPLDVKQGDKVRIRLINASSSTTHPMHLHGHQFTVVAEDGNELPPAQQRTRNTITLNPGETYDVEVTANNPGVWAFHCHELHHAGSGMLTLFKYEGYNVLSGSQQDTNTNTEDSMMNHSMH